MTDKTDVVPVPSADQSMIDSLESDLRGLTGDWLEMGIDELLDNEAVKSIPVVNTIKHIYSGAVSIRDYLLTRKVLNFLQPLTNTSMSERAEFADRLAKEEGTRNRVGGRLLLLLDRLDDLDKPKIIGLLYLACLRNEISPGELQRLCSIVDRSFLPDLKELATWRNGEATDPISGPFMEALGLVVVTAEDLGGWDGDKTGSSKTYAVSELGGKLISAAFREPVA